MWLPFGGEEIQEAFASVLKMFYLNIGSNPMSVCVFVCV